MVVKTNGLSNLEIIAINHQTHEQYDDVLKEAQGLLTRSYTPDEILSYDEAKAELSDAANDAYTWLIARDKNTRKVVSTVVFDVWPIPRAPIDRKLISDGRTQYTPIFYATAYGDGHEPILKRLIGENVVGLANKYSNMKGKRNIGILTGDTRHVKVLRELSKQHGGGYLGKIGVPTLEDAKIEQDYEINFKAAGNEKLIFIPFNKRWTNSAAERVVASYLDEGYNGKQPEDTGYRPLTNAGYFNKFVNTLHERNTGKYVIPRPITFTK